MNWPVLIGTILVGVLSAWWIFRDARGRDHNPSLWAVGCVFAALAAGIPGTLGVLAIYYVLRPRGALLMCPHCSKRYISNLAFCPHCQKPVKKDCLKCHELMELDEELCPHCGMRMV
jgi:hypothetical protein